MEESPSKSAHDVVEEVSTERLLEELSDGAKRQTSLVAQLKGRYVGDFGLSAQKDEEIASLKAQLAEAQSVAEAAKADAKRCADKSVSAQAELDRERVDAARLRAECQLAMDTLEHGKEKMFADIDGLRNRVRDLVAEQELKLRELCIAYDKELYPYLLSTISERRYLFASLHISLIIHVKYLWLLAK